MKKYKITSLVTILLLICIFIMPISSKAATGSFSTSKSSVSLTEGGNTTVNVVATNCEGKFSITSSNTNVVKVDTSRTDHTVHR